jgi:hypothetical protein
MMTPGFGQRVRLAIAAIAVLSLAACARHAAEPPVATPSVSLPAPSAPRGGVVDVHYRFAVSPDAPPFNERYTVFVHVTDADGNRAWTSDHEPPTAATEWKPGSVVEYTRPMSIPRGAKLGRVSLEIGLYSPQTGKRLPLEGTEGDRRSYRVASFDVVRERVSGTQVTFTSGWYDAEAPENAQGAEWRWSKRAATLSARNPRHDAVLVLDVDQPLTTGSEPQHVQIHNGAAPIATITVTPGTRTRFTVPVTAMQLGDADAVRFTLAVDRTFVPARVTGAGSADQRDLGIRVFSASLEPVSEASRQP